MLGGKELESKVWMDGLWEVFREMYPKLSFGILEISQLMIYWYYVGQAGDLEKGAGKWALGLCVTVGCLASSVWFPLWLSWLLVTGVLVLYVMFFDNEPFGRQWRIVLPPGLVLALCALLPDVCGLWGIAFPVEGAFLCHGIVLLVFLLLLSKKRESLQVWNGIMTVVSFLAIASFQWLLCGRLHMAVGEEMKVILLWGSVLLEFALFFMVEGTLFFYKKGFEFRTEQFRSELMEHSYGEIRDIYMDMRGWRHDYHNHMQVMKAKLTMGDIEGIGAYLDELERELDRVDTLVKSGNLMVDAILNSKLTLARRNEIRVNCRARLPEQLSVEDVDLCVILGNLLDNAIEACQALEKESRFLRLYIAVNKGQFYLSVQNSAREEPDFNARNYISRKRGNHGLGMKRVKAAVDKYQGYLNLANEPGVFAAEVTIPLSVFS